MKRILILLLIAATLLTVTPVGACFGPKLYVGADESPRQQLFYALLALYIKEKTGTESELVPLATSRPLQLLEDDRADLVIDPRGDFGSRPVLFRVEGLPLILSGPRPVEELQFTLVGPALAKLSRLLNADDFTQLVDRVAQGEPPAATARAFLTDRGWI